MGRNAEAFMEQISYYWNCLAKTKDKVKYMDKMVEHWNKLDPSRKKKETDK